LNLNNPFHLPLAFTGLEWTVVLCAALTLWHALLRFREGDTFHLFVWACVFCYGVTMELLSYRFFPAYAHARFTVMFDGQKLPLYITGIYPLLIYSAIAATARLGLSRAAEPFVVAFATVLVDAPWDILNEPIGWWSWSATDPIVRTRWLGVPMTNFLWHVAFDGSAAFLTRLVHPTASRGRRIFLAAPLVGFATIVVGIIAFIPYHLVHRLGVPDQWSVAVVVTACALVFALARRGHPRLPIPRATDRLLLAIPLLFEGFLMVVLLAGRIRDAHALAAGVIAIGAVCFYLYTCRRPSHQAVPNG